MTTIEQKYAELKAAGFVPLIDLPVVPVPTGDQQGTFFTFATANGPVNIYFHPTTDAHEVHGAILATYLANGGPLGQLGYPISDEQDDQVRDLVFGRVSEFQKGSIFFNPSTGLTSIMMVGPVIANDFELLVGIDVSAFQAAIDWRQVATRGTTDGDQIAFAYIKATEGDAGRDSQFTANWTNSRGVLPRGPYHFFHARKVVDDTRVQANNFISAVTAAGDNAELPPMVDVESLPPGVAVPEAIASLQFFLSIVEQGFGKRPIIYTYPSFWRQTMNNVNDFSRSSRLWIANYGSKRSDGGFDPRGVGPLMPGGWTQFALWQNAVKPGVAGITGLVDRDLALVPQGTDLATFLSQN